MMKKVRIIFLVILVSLVCVYYVGELLAFNNSVEWHNERHPLTLVSGLDGKIKKVDGIKIGDYYYDNNFYHNLSLNPNLGDGKSCSICQGKKDKPLLIKIFWPLYNINEGKYLSKR